MPRTNGLSPCPSSTRPSRYRWISSLLLRNQTKPSRDCCSSAISAPAASMSSSPRLAIGAGSAIHCTSSPGSPVRSTSAESGLGGNGPASYGPRLVCRLADRFVQRARLRLIRRQLDVRHPGRTTAVGQQRHRRAEAPTRAAEHQVLQRAAQADVLLPPERIDRTGAARRRRATRRSRRRRRRRSTAGCCAGSRPVRRRHRAQRTGVSRQSAQGS